MAMNFIWDHVCCIAKEIKKGSETYAPVNMATKKLMKFVLNALNRVSMIKNKNYAFV